MKIKKPDQSEHKIFNDHAYLTTVVCKSYSSMPTQSEPAAALISRGKFPSWFHGMMTRKQAEERLNSAPNGSFLIRFSQSQFGYSLSHRLALIFVNAITCMM